MTRNKPYRKYKWVSSTGIVTLKQLIPIIVLMIVLLLAALVWLIVQSSGGQEDYSNEPGIDSGARIEIESLRQQIEALRGQIEVLQNQVQEIGSVPQVTDHLDSQTVVKNGPNTILDSYAQVVQIATRRKVNNSISVGGPTFLEGFLGRPREVLSDNCDPMTNPKLKKLLVVTDVGPIKVRMLQPAVDSLKRVFEKVRATDPDLYERINTAGSLCVRQIRGTIGRTSTHSFGLAVDLNIDGKLDTLGDGKTQLGLTILADFFNEEGWVWGAGFTREDSMHFEVSRQKLEQWREEGKI